MNAISRCAVTAALVAVACGLRVHAEPQAALTVRLYNTSGISAPELLAARRAIESTFQDTGLAFDRPAVRASCQQDSVDSCSESLKPLEMVVRIINAPASSPTIHARGLRRGLCHQGDRSRLAGHGVLGPDRQRRHARRRRCRHALGLVIAHELGHLLLGSGYHGGTGVMRADWPEELLTHNGEPWRFSTLEAARMRQAANLF